jgi:HK97 family phage major capsid protein
MSTEIKEQDVAEVLEKGLDSVKAKIDTDIKRVESDIENLQEKMNEQAKSSGDVESSLKTQLANAEKTITSLKERQDAFETQNGRLGAKAEQKGFGELLRKGLEDNATKLKAFKDNRSPISMELKTLMNTKATMTEADNLTGTVIDPTRVPGVKYDPERRQRIRQFLPQGTTNSNAIWYVQETAFTDNTNVVAEGALKPENDLDLEQKSAAVTKIAAHFDVSEEMLDDISYLASHISLRGTDKYYNKEDQQLLYGTGLSNQLEGLTVSSTDYALDEYTGDSNAQEYDILLEAHKQLRNQNYMPTANLVSIDRYFQLLRRKDTDGRYILPPGVTFDNGVIRVMGTPIIASNALSDDDFLVADFPMLTTLFDRSGVNVRFYDQNEDNAVKNLVTVVIEGRLALPTYLPNAGRYGDFSTAITNAGNS